MNDWRQPVESEEDSTPLAAGAAGMPPVLGSGCLSRFDPEALTEESGSDYADAAQLLTLLRQQSGG